ncbi:hypothetical protein DFJ74DRAFT_769354 [Hyaloraphidium curvatum]|nr:hypothetical protein DFJ74DRAFT_769354 [Hyaloraphidium curvatum]
MAPAAAGPVPDDYPKAVTGRSLNTLFLLSLVAFLCSATYGYDGSLMSGINAMSQYQDFFGVQPTGAMTSLIFSIYNVGNICAVPFSGPIADRFGRKISMAIGCGIIVVGAIINGTSTVLAQFIVGRFVLGFGICIASVGAPSWVVETTPPEYRGRVTGLYNTFWWVGNITASWTLYGTAYIQSEWAWRIPLFLQCIFGGSVCFLVWLLPESPRWLVAKGRNDEARAVFTKYHGAGDPNHPIVTVQMEELIAAQEEEARRKEAEAAVTSSKGGISQYIGDYSPLYNSRSALYRTFILACFSIFGQGSGNAVVSYFMPVMLDAAGITDQSTQLLLNAINSVLSFSSAVTGASLMDKFGRRPLLLTSTSLATLLFTGITITSALAAESTNVNSSLGTATVVLIYAFGIVFSFAWTPMQVLGPAEVLSNEARAKGMSLNNLLVNAAGFFNSFVTPIAMGALGWKWYIFYVIWDTLEVITIYFFFPETKGRTLEELNAVFEAKNPVKESLKPRAAPVLAEGEETVPEVAAIPKMTDLVRVPTVPGFLPVARVGTGEDRSTNQLRKRTMTATALEAGMAGESVQLGETAPKIDAVQTDVAAPK